jgi:hypothetical protein
LPRIVGPLSFVPGPRRLLLEHDRRSEDHRGRVFTCSPNVLTSSNVPPDGRKESFRQARRARLTDVFDEADTSVWWTDDPAHHMMVPLMASTGK